MIISGRPIAERLVDEPRTRISVAPLRNHILAALSPSSIPRYVVVPMSPGKILVARDAPLRHVFFIESGLVCFYDGAGGEPSPQLAMLGADGAVGLLEVLSGAWTAFATAVIQVQGDAIRMDAIDVARLLGSPSGVASHGTTDAARLAVQALVRQVMETAAVNARDSLAQRLVRWLLMARTRLAANDIPVTHEALAGMLGVRRAGVTVAIAALQLQGLVRTGRGRITVLDVDGMARFNVRGNARRP